jgi:hypothetical protein
MQALAGCIDIGSSEALVTRDTLEHTFEAAGEPVTISIDMAKADPTSSVDVFYVSRSRRDGEPLFELGLFEDQESARTHIVNVQATPESNLFLARERNVVLGIPSSLTRADRDRVVAILGKL